MSTKNAVNVIVLAAIAIFKALKVHAANPRKFRFSETLHKSFEAAGFDCRRTVTADASGRQVDVVDYPVVVATGTKGHYRVVRGAGRLGTIVKGLTHDDPVIRAMYTKMVLDGVVKVLVLPKDTPAAKLIEYASDNDALKENWSPVEAFTQWVKLVKLDRYSVTSASLMVGHPGRHQIYEHLSRCSPEIIKAWTDYANKVPGALRITNDKIKNLGNMAHKYREANDGANVKKSDRGPDYDAKEKEVLAGKRGAAVSQRFTATPIQLVTVCQELRDYPLAKIPRDLVADWIRELAGLQADGKTVITETKDHFTRFWAAHLASIAIKA